MASQVNWYAEDVFVMAEGATDELLAELAFEGEGLAKPGAPVDTGFMRNALYGIAPGQSHRGEAVAAARATADREIAPAPQVGDHEAAIHGAAEYTIYQETRVGFMYRALQGLAAIAPGIIQRVGRLHFG
jgi:hypothetical protein